MGVRVGIDLGTTYSVVAWIDPHTGLPTIIKNENGHTITPSVIHFLPNGRYECGEDAKEAFEDNEQGTASAFKRYMGTKEVCCTAYGKNYTAEQLSAILLKYLKEQAENTLGQKIDSAVITVPAYFHNKEREDTIQAGREAGLNVLGIIHEPTAAAMCYGQQKWRENAIIMVYDLGGGTFDVTLVGMGKNHQLESLCTDGDHRLGGKDWDEKLAKLVLKKIKDEYEIDFQPAEEERLLAELRCSAENWKKELSKQSAQVNCKVRVKDYGMCTVTVTRREFDLATRTLLEYTGGKCEAVLAQRGLTWADVTDVLLVGGSTRMPQVREFLKAKHHGKGPISHVNPDEAVALGAAIQTGVEAQGYKILSANGPKSIDDLQGKALAARYAGPVGEAETLQLASIGVRDVQAHGMGIVAVNAEGTAYINKNIVPPNTSFPVKYAAEVKLYTKPDENNEMEIFVLEGTETQPGLNVFNAKYVVSGIRHERGGARMRVQYSYDKNGIIHVQARQGDGYRDLPIREEEVTEADKNRFDGPVERMQLGAIDNDCTLVLALDVSGSMYGTPMMYAKNAMEEFVRQFENTGTRIGIIAFSDSYEWFTRPTADTERCIHKIREIECAVTGNGNLSHPFKTIYEELSQTYGTRYAIALADGQWCNQDNAIKWAKMCNDAGIEVIGMGFGHANKDFLKAISSKADLSMFTPSASGLNACFGKIAQVIGTGNNKGGSSEQEETATWKTNEE